MKTHAINCVIAVIVAALAGQFLSVPAPAYAQEAPAKPAGTPIDAFMERLSDNPQTAVQAARQVRDAAIAAWPTGGIDPIIQAVQDHAVVELIASLPPSSRTMLTEVWGTHPTFVAALARVYTDRNDGSMVATLAQAIAGGHAEAMTQYPDLAAAVCVVLDRAHTYPGLGAIRPNGAEVFAALVFGHQDRRIMALPLDQLPAEILVYLTDTALTGEGIRKIFHDRRPRSPLDLYKTVRYQQAGLLAGEPAPKPEDFTFDRIAERGGVGPLRSFYAEQLGQAFGYPVSLATGRLGDERFLAPVFLEPQRRGYAWNITAVADHPGLAMGNTTHPVTGQPMPLPELVVTSDLARAGADNARKAWALLKAAGHAHHTAKLPMLEASQTLTLGFADAWAQALDLKLEQAAGEPDGAQRVLAEFLARADQIAPLLATDLAMRSISALGDQRGALLEWLSMVSRRDPHRYAAAQLALGDTALERGDRAAAMKAYEDLLNRHADDTPLALDALARLETMIAQDGRGGETIELYARTHRKFRTPRTSEEAEARASAFMIVGERYEKLLINAGREREAERLRRRLDQTLP